MSGGRKSRDKGAAGEREVIRLLRRVWPAAERNLDQVRETSGRDVTGTPGWVVQVKRLAKAPAVEAMLREAQGEVGPDESAVLVIRGDRGEWLAVTYLDEYLDLVEGQVGAVTAGEFLRAARVPLALAAGGGR